MKTGFTNTGFLLLLSGCEKTEEYNQDVIFQIEYINRVWGCQHKGQIIDSSGNVKRFDLLATWHFPDKDGYLSLSEMNENPDQLGEIDCIADKGILADSFSKIVKAEVEN
ncbi:MAG: hypothetical protein JSV24_06360 [Bacteroidales bacterium]|nr:MAG: hypothetical protein JSV24_06360 [Bacteroidales bacterium]